MEDSWRLISVEEIKDISENSLATGPFGSSISSRFFVKNGVPVIRGSNLSEKVGERLVEDDYVFIEPKKAEEFRRSVVKRGDLIFTSWGTINQVGLIDENSRYPVYIISNKQMKLTPNPDMADSLFLYYLFSSPKMQDKILAEGIGSSVPGFNLGQLRRIKINLPPLPVQRTISYCLDTLDQRIRLNKHINRTLESIARSVFKSWFVDFDPVRAKAEGKQPFGIDEETAALFPSGFEDSELGVIPKGWSYSTLNNIDMGIFTGSRPRGGAIREGIPSIGAENIIGLGSYDYSKEKYIPPEHYEALVRRGANLRQRDVLLYKDGAQLGRKAIFDCGYPHNECAVNEHVFILRSKTLTFQRYLFFWLDKPSITNEIVNLNSNSAQPGITRSAVLTLPILVPDDKIILTFDDLVGPLLNRIFHNCIENQTLSALRDALLPKLLSGEIRVPRGAD